MVVALVDMRSTADLGRLAEFATEIGARVDLVAAARGTVNLPEDVLEKGQALVAEHETTQTTEPADSRAGHPGAARVELGWPRGLPDGGRHRLHARATNTAGRGAARDGRAGRRSAAGGGAARPRTRLRGADVRAAQLARELEQVVSAEVRYSTTTRSPVLALDDPGYAIRTRLVFPAHDDPDDGPGERYAYNVAGAGFDAVVAVVDSAADTPALHAPDGLLAQLAEHTPERPARRRSVVSPRTAVHRKALHAPRAPPRPSLLLVRARRGRLAAAGPLGRDAGGCAASRGARGGDPERRRPLRGVAAGQVPAEHPVPGAVPDGPRHLGRRIAQAVGAVTELVLAERSPAPRTRLAGPRGHPRRCPDAPLRPGADGLDLPHYAVSIVRGRGIDANALRWLAARHDPADVVFVDGWTGKGAITRELTEAIREFESAEGVTGFDPEIAVLADPGSCVRTYGTREDFLIPSACLNSTVSGLISRTVLRSGPGRRVRLPRREVLPRARRLRRLRRLPGRRRHHFPTSPTRHAPPGFLATDRTPTWEGWAAVKRSARSTRSTT